jgi:Zn-dependent protease with chaperone function
MGDESGRTGRESADGRKDRVRFPGISYRAYEHPLALTALTAMRKIRGFDVALKGMNAVVSEPVIRMQHVSSAIRVGPGQLRHLHEIKEEAAEILDLDDPPELYVRGAIPGINAFTIGMKRPFIVMTPGIIELLDETELRFVLGHELGHVLSGHSLYQTMGHVLASAGGLSSIPGVGVAAEGIEAGIREWHRKSELSCDRAGLLVAQDPTAAISALMKLAAGSRIPNLNVDDFLQQAAEFELDTTGARNRIYKFMLPSESHPILVLRAAELDRWVRTGGYACIVEQREYETRSDDRDTTVRETVRGHFNAAMETRRQKVSERLARQSGRAPE